MIDVVANFQTEITALCRKYGVRKLELFGSAASGAFDPTRSDIDFFYEFDSKQELLADRFFGLMEGLERLFGRKVDLVSSQDAKNPYFLEVANRHRVTLHPVCTTASASPTTSSFSATSLSSPRSA